MKFLFDQNISHKILKFIPNQFSASSTIKKEGLLNATDREIWEFAKQNGYIIVTNDSDFNDLNLLFGFPPKIIWIRTGNLATQDLADLLIANAEEIIKFNEDEDYGCFEIVRMK
ncbi:DUF5615 family PIN-like protein [Cyclobacterium plantarum]|uniref:DUF5615 family PIN-like protein n=1 Tax=Cyclobacterium plantarum TaxID=2716263 RepID=A0ABX0H9P1_9BACT|nr:DUF5615 family PIN-like protein [Cyclobacterium plantarum]NHE57161.1 DUF5615 family PIN-like protein [Cyclobacterium plantarum]